MAPPVAGPSPSISAPQSAFVHRYGPWALVAGASEGLGAAFAHALARRQMNLVLVARRAEMLEELRTTLMRAHAIDVRCIALDLATVEVGARIGELAVEHPIGLLVYNAAYAPVGAFLDKPLAELNRTIDVNVRGPVACVHALAPGMVARGRGGVVLMSSLAGAQGAPRISAYGATKAFNTALGEALWHELGARGVDVVVCKAGAITTPAYRQSATRPAPGTLDPDAVAETTLRALGHGPVVVPGGINRAAAFVLGRLLPRGWAVRMMAHNTKDLT